MRFPRCGSSCAFRQFEIAFMHERCGRDNARSIGPFVLSKPMSDPLGYRLGTLRKVHGRKTSFV